MTDAPTREQIDVLLSLQEGNYELRKRLAVAEFDADAAEAGAETAEKARKEAQEAEVAKAAEAANLALSRAAAAPVLATGAAAVLVASLAARRRLLASEAAAAVAAFGVATRGAGALRAPPPPLPPGVSASDAARLFSILREEAAVAALYDSNAGAAQTPTRQRITETATTVTSPVGLVASPVATQSVAVAADADASEAARVRALLDHVHTARAALVNQRAALDARCAAHAEKQEALRCDAEAWSARADASEAAARVLLHVNRPMQLTSASAAARAPSLRSFEDCL